MVRAKIDTAAVPLLPVLYLDAATAHSGVDLFQVRQHIAVSQHRAFATPVVPPVYCRKAKSSGTSSV